MTIVSVVFKKCLILPPPLTVVIIVLRAPLLSQFICCMMLQRYLSFPPVVSFRFVDSTEIMAANDFFRYLLLHPASVAPDNKSEGGAGFDLHAVLWSASGQEVVIPPGEKAFIGTGVVVMLPSGTYGRVAPRSGFPLDFGVDVLGGLITSDYRGEIKIIIANSSDKAFTLRQGDRVAQLIIEKFDNLDSMRLLSIGASSNSGR